MASLMGGLASFPGSAAAGPGPTVAETAPGDDEPAARPLVLLLTADLDGDAALRRAVRTELNDVAVDFEAVAASTPANLEARLVAAEALLHERRALVVIWVERGEDALVLNFVAELGMVRRSVVGAGAEAAAVIIRYFVADLSEGRELGFRPRAESGAEAGGAEEEPGAQEDPGAEEEPEPQRGGQGGAGDEDPGRKTPPARVFEPFSHVGARGRARLEAAYLGQVWSEQRPWEHSAEFSGGWRHRSGAHLGASFQVAPVYQSQEGTQTSLGLLWFTVRRYPASIYAGYQHEWPALRLLLDSTVRVGAEFVTRASLGGAEALADLELGPARATAFLEPRLSLAWVALPPVALFLAAGVRTLLVQHDYSVELSSPEGTTVVEYLDTRPLSPTVIVGLALFL